MKKMILFFIIATVFVSSCTRKESNVGEIANPIVIGLSKPYFEKLTKDDIKLLEKRIIKDTGYDVVIKKFDDSIELIKHIGSKRVDIAFTTLNEYLIAREEYRVIATLDENIKSIHMLNGKKFVSRSPYSISGFVLPSILFLKANVKVDFIFSGSFEESYKMLKEKKADAGGFYKNFASNHKDLKVIYEIGPVPNEPVIARKKLKKEIIDRIKNEIISLSNDKEFKELFKKMADIDGFSEANVSDYVEIHNVIKNYSNGIYSLIPDGVSIKKLNEEYNFN
jgi:ABC-type phosphate/phosphonate transport system substrate-binding protein